MRREMERRVSNSAGSSDMGLENSNLLNFPIFQQDEIGGLKTYQRFTFAVQRDHINQNQAAAGAEGRRF
jgi:hypothetical protein